MCKVIEYYNPQCGHAFRYRLESRCQNGFSYAARSCKGDGNQVVGYRPFSEPRACEACNDDALESPEQIYHVCAGEIQACSDARWWHGCYVAEALQEELRYERHLNALVALNRCEHFEDAEEEVFKGCLGSSNDETEYDCDLEFEQGGHEERHCVLEEDLKSDDSSVYFSSTEHPRDAALQELVAEDEDDEENNRDIADALALCGYAPSDQDFNRKSTVGWLVGVDSRIADDSEADIMDICDSSDADSECDWNSAAEADVEDNCGASEAED